MRFWHKEDNELVLNRLIGEKKDIVFSCILKSRAILESNLNGNPYITDEERMEALEFAGGRITIC